MTQLIFDQISAKVGDVIPIGATDTVIFHGGPASAASVTFDDALGDGLIPRISFGGHTVEFNGEAAVVSAHLGMVFDDGSHLLIGDPLDNALTGGAGGDGLFGGEGADTLDGGDGDNLIQGNQGNDVLEARDGADTIYGGQGDDLIVSDSTGHRVLDDFHVRGDFAQGNKGNDTITGGGGNDTLLGGQGDDRIDGGVDGFDVLNGNLGNDVVAAGGFSSLFGEDGADTLQARASGCTLSGGAGADLFEFTFNAGFATVTDWAGEDRISVSRQHGAVAFQEAMANDRAAAGAAADSLMQAGANVVAVQVGADVVVYFQTIGTPDADLNVVLVGRALADISAGNFV